jgi:hypothetical protein
MRKIFLSLALVIALSSPSFGHGLAAPAPWDDIVYTECPEAVQSAARVGKWLMLLPGAIVGTAGGLLYAPFSDDAVLAIGAGTYAGAVGGNIIGGALTGTIPYGIYRAFNWSGCGGKQ